MKNKGKMLSMTLGKSYKDLELQSETNKTCSEGSLTESIAASIKKIVKTTNS